MSPSVLKTHQNLHGWKHTERTLLRPPYVERRTTRPPCSPADCGAHAQAGLGQGAPCFLGAVTAGSLLSTHYSFSVPFKVPGYLPGLS